VPLVTDKNAISFEVRAVMYMSASADTARVVKQRRRQRWGTEARTPLDFQQFHF